MKNMSAVPDYPPSEPTTIGIRALKQNASAVVARVAAGETLTITDRGRPVARIVPLERKGRVQEMIDAGLITMPERPQEEWIAEHMVDGKWVAPVSWPEDGPTALEVLLEMREEEDYK